MSGHGALYDSLWGKGELPEWAKCRPLTPEERKRGRQKRDRQESSYSGLSNAEDNYNKLRKNPKLVVVNDKEARLIYFLFTGRQLTVTSISENARAFLQGALMAAIDGSYAFDFIKGVLDSAYMKLPPSDAAALVELALKVTAKLLIFMYKHMGHEHSGNKPHLYSAVVGAIAWDCGAYFQSIGQNVKI